MAPLSPGASIQLEQYQRKSAYWRRMPGALPEYLPPFYHPRCLKTSWTCHPRWQIIFTSVAFLVSSLSSSFRTSKKALLRWDNFLKQYQQEVCILIAKSCPMFAKRQVIFMSPILSLAINFFSCWRELSSVISCQIMMGIFYVSTRGKCVIVRVFKNFDTTFGKFLSVNCSIAVLKPAGCIFQRFGGREIFRLLTCFIVSMQVK